MFWAPCCSRGGWMGVGVVGGCTPHTCTCMCMHTHACVVNMKISCKWLPPLGESLGIPYDVICACMCMRAYACLGGTLSPPPHPHPLTPPHPPGGTPGISQNSRALELIEIFQFHLKIWYLWRLPHPWVGVWFGGWVGGLIGGDRSNH